MARDPLEPSRATAQGQYLALARGLGRYGRKGRIIALVWLLAIVASFLTVIVLVLAQ